MEADSLSRIALELMASFLWTFQAPVAWTASKLVTNRSYVSRPPEKDTWENWMEDAQRRKKLFSQKKGS